MDKPDNYPKDEDYDVTLKEFLTSGAAIGVYGLMAFVFGLMYFMSKGFGV